MVATRPQADGRAARVLVSIAVVAVVAIDALYLAIVRDQGGPPPENALVTPLIAGFLALLGAMLLISLVSRGPVVAGLRGAASGGLLVLAALSALTIGAAVLVAALLTIAATVVTLVASPRTRTLVSAGVGFVLAIGILAVGLQFAWQQITCPATGESGGTTASFTGQGVSYQCNNGRLTTSP